MRVAAALLGLVASASAVDVAQYSLLKGGYLCGRSPVAGDKFEAGVTGWFGACGLHHGGQYQVDLAKPINGFDSFKWRFQVNECCGGRAVYFFDENTQKWIGFGGGSGFHAQWLTRSNLDHQNAKITKIKFVYGGRSTAPRIFYTYALEMYKNGEEVLPNAKWEQERDQRRAVEEERIQQERDNEFHNKKTHTLVQADQEREQKKQVILTEAEDDFQVKKAEIKRQAAWSFGQAKIDMIEAGWERFKTRVYGSMTQPHLTQERKERILETARTRHDAKIAAIRAQYGL